MKQSHLIFLVDLPKILNEEVAALTVLKRLYLIKVVSRPQKLSGGVKADFVFALLT